MACEEKRREEKRKSRDWLSFVAYLKLLHVLWCLRYSKLLDNCFSVSHLWVVTPWCVCFLPFGNNSLMDGNGRKKKIN